MTARTYIEDVWGEPVEGGRYFQHQHGRDVPCDYDCGGGWVPAPEFVRQAEGFRK